MSGGPRLLEVTNDEQRVDARMAANASLSISYTIVCCIGAATAMSQPQRCEPQEALVLLTVLNQSWS